MAFLHGNKEEAVYMSQSKGYIIPNGQNKLWKLMKEIYGLKQAAKVWHTKICETLRKLNFIQTTADTCFTQGDS